MALHHNTKQKAQILQVLENNRNHITAEEIITALQQSGISVGRATVYRFLREMEEAGKVKKYSMGEKNMSYYQYVGDGDCSGHYHLMCAVCGRLEHLDPSFSISFVKSAKESHGFEIDCTKTVFYGKCKDCIGK